MHFIWHLSAAYSVAAVILPAKLYGTPTDKFIMLTTPHGACYINISEV